MTSYTSWEINAPAVPAAADTPDPVSAPPAEANVEVGHPTWAEDLLESLRNAPCDPVSLDLLDLVPGTLPNGYGRGSMPSTWSGNGYDVEGPEHHLYSLGETCREYLGRGAERFMREGKASTNVIADALPKVTF